MTRERFDMIKAQAERFAREIEWADFPRLPKVASLLEWHNLWFRLINEPVYQSKLQRELRALLEQCETQYQQLPGQGYVELEAAELVGYAMIGVLVTQFPVARPMAQHVLRIKFRSIDEAFHVEPGAMKREPPPRDMTTGGAA